MANDDVARTLDAVANQMQVVAGLTGTRRRSVTADPETLTALERAVDRIVRLLRHSTEDAGGRLTKSCLPVGGPAPGDLPRDRASIVRHHDTPDRGARSSAAWIRYRLNRRSYGDE